MMHSPRYAEWANQNQLRAYPFVDDHGQGIPTELLADLQLAVPDTADAVWLSSVRVTPSLVSITVSSDAGPLCAGTYAREGMGHLATQPLEPFGVFGGGWVTFGRLPDTLFFKGTAETARLVDRAVRRMPSLPVRSLRKHGGGSRQLQGVPAIESSDTVKVTRSGDHGIVLSLQRPELIESFLGPCQPQEQTCAVQPIRSINGVCADSSGRITLVIRQRSDEGDA